MAKLPNSFDGITLLNSTLLFKCIIETPQSGQRAEPFLWVVIPSSQYCLVSFLARS